ncbi:unnamed protein product [Heterobilharzia americana]|nr:unnamed protein product [Heterobilharzia americana]
MGLGSSVVSTFDALGVEGKTGAKNTVGLLEPRDIQSNFALDSRSLLSSIVNNIPLPRIELMYFDGHPCQYWLPMSQSGSGIETKLTDKGQMLTCLLYFHKGQAKTAIEACVLLSAVFGYDRAREILRDLFEQEHMIARSLTDDVIGNRQSVESTAGAMNGFSVKLRNVQITLSQTGSVTDLDLPANSEAILSRVPIIFT